jgi:hypothetical protein
VIRVGVDEAGYGPLLGPLVVAGAAFRVPGGEGPSLRKRASGIWGRAGARKDGVVPIDDSKEVYRRHGFDGLARGVSSAVAASGKALPTDLRDWLARFGDRPCDAVATDPWYAGPEQARVPGYEPPGRLREKLLLRGIDALGLVVSPATPSELNDAWDATGNKARVLFLASIAVLVRVLADWPGEDVEATLDREGGRLDYAAYLADAFPWRSITREPSEPGTARYSMEEGGRRVTITFVTGGDREDLAVGLASMAAKMTRELFMARLNAWFFERDPRLKRTAGYVEDGRRFLEDAKEVLRRERVDLRRFVRTR